MILPKKTSYYPEATQLMANRIVTKKMTLIWSLAKKLSVKAIKKLDIYRISTFDSEHEYGDTYDLDQYDNTCDSNNIV
jgi:hypothetical protein